MSNLQELKNTAENPLLNKIKEIKNSGVEFRKLENLFNIRNGYTPSKKNESYWTGNTIIPWFRLEDIRENGRVLKDSIQHVTPEAIKGELFEKDSLIISTSATIGEQALIETDFLVNQRFTVLTLKEEFKEKLLPKFLLHYAYILSQYCKDNTNLGTFQSVDMTKFRNFEIPIPPLEVQAEIVRILDTFTELIKELIKEHELRKKQYSYYRDKLLTFETDIQYKNLSDICSFIYGYTEKAKDEGNARFVRITDILETGCLNPEGAKYINLTSECEKYLLKKGDLLTARAGATYGKTLYFDEDYPAVYASYLIKLNLDNNLILNRYYWHFAKSSYYWKQANKLAVGGAQPNLNANSLAKIIVPLPPLDTQKRIVDILDNFEKYCNDLQIGLPAEIEARKKQYNFYRDKLLRFEPINIAKIEKEIDEILTNEPNCDSLRREEKRREEKRREEKRREEKRRIIDGLIALYWYVYQVAPVKLESVAGVYDGTHKTPKYTSSGVKFVSVENINNLYATKKYISEEDYKNYKIKPQIDDVFMTRIGSIGICSVVNSNEPLAYYVSLALLRPNHNYIIGKYLKYIIESSIGKKELEKRSLLTAIPIKINKNEIGNIEIPIPPLDTQKRIVDILDNFEKYTNDLQEGLPAEIEKRKKQYAYYRDELLRFERK